MLDAETKRRIDACRDILVGKVPDPKSQVEQITIALIYKFMDDMDAEAEELGGTRTFFAGDYARFGWAKLMAPGLGGFDVLALYSEAIGKMNENPGVPPLFRDIFKNAYLPYRDPETLKSFLKEINYFSYDHSERLGDAFEYLLSVLGSQGDAGQFRTPRHIIDFMVEVLDPQKNETILDPACGTAGFLISAWKHILKANTKKTTGDKLTPDERARLAGAIRGYDISPDMVRLSLVNLYLHGFADPHIVEYDTLTQDDKWNEVADVILANPPFMSPKGGIKPHKRFSVQATRSEVLFVDYMAEHLTATGRAAIVVPEGIIFQSGTAYKSLRKMLVDTSLVAVVSLPAGVFNPYSGVKTSILILDKRVHKQTDKVLFVKVQNDGFNLGAQRRAVANSDLPEATRLLRSWMVAPQDFEGDGVMAQAVARSRLGENGDFNLSGERYVVVPDSVSQTWPRVPLGEFARLINGRAYKQEELLNSGPTPVLRVGNFFSNRSWYYSDLKLDDDKYCDQGDLLYAWSASFGPRIWEGPRAIFHYHIWKIETTEAIDKKFLFYLLQSDSENIKAEGNGIAMTHATKGGMEHRKFPLPPLEVQHQIVAEIEGYQKAIEDHRKAIEELEQQIKSTVNKVWGG
ncbi:MAG: N-6 DNA methylase [Polaromonas sp.]